MEKVLCCLNLSYALFDRKMVSFFLSILFYFIFADFRYDQTANARFGDRDTEVPQCYIQCFINCIQGYINTILVTIYCCLITRTV